jgi:hypothetical protein
MRDHLILPNALVNKAGDHRTIGTSFVRYEDLVT